MIWLQIYLLAGLVAHKALWEALKRRNSRNNQANHKRQPIILKLVKGAKVAILFGMVAQTIAPDALNILPIAELSPDALRGAGVVIYTTGLVVAMLGRIQIGANWSDIESVQVKRNQSVVSHGLYRYIRHPIYVGDLLLLAGFELSLNSWLALGAGLLAPVILWKALREERMLIESLPGYEKYCARTKRFIPFVV